MLTLELIQEAYARIKAVVHRTPVITSRSFDEAVAQASGQDKARVFFKCENLQRAGAFKFRGATNKILSLTAEEKARGVAAFSSGNHAQAVALAAREAGTRAIIVMPTDAPKSKIAATRGYGAEVHFFDRQRDDREMVARNLAERERLVLVPPYDDYLVMAGQGTCALELLEEVPGLDCLFTPCSGGGLFAGASTVVKTLKPEARCFAVEPETGNDTLLSILKGERVTIPPPPTIADGARVQTPGALTFPITRRNTEKVLTVSDDELIETLRFILLRMKILVEPTGALGAAAAFSGKLPPEVKRIGIVLSGGNIDPDALARLLSEQGQ
jgi:threonine dehydratase